MTNPYPHILQTPEWKKAKTHAHPNWSGDLWVRYEDEFQVVDEVEDWSKVRSSVLILSRNLPLNQKIHYIPRGPFVDWSNKADVEQVLSHIKKIANDSGVIFTRMEPNIIKEKYPFNISKSMGFVQTSDYVQAFDTVKVAIDKSDDELIESFHKKHRYNIRLAKKRGLTVRSSINPDDVSRFYELTERTNDRRKGVMNPHNENYYQNIVRELGNYGYAKVYIVEKDNVPISSSIVFLFGDEAIYMFGASDYRYRRDMPNHLREWESMRDARENGCKRFDLWGITMRNDPAEGIKRYKLGYDENILEMAGTFDYYPSLWKYSFYKMVNKVRRATVV
jgi:lipid II:glycine glycyltransferase (peptidoglycan interpeptide bridge formation enzyme)